MKEGYKRLQFDFSEDAVNRIDNLADITEASTKAEVVRRALKFYEYTVQMLEKGYDLEFNKNGEKVVVPPVIL